MLRLVEYGLLAVSLLVVVGLVMRGPRGAAAKAGDGSEHENEQSQKG
jgi:hypothetical protein